MAKFDIYRNQAGTGYLLDVQSDLLSGLNTRMVVPLLPISAGPKPAERLNPVFEIDGEGVLVATQFMAAVQQGELRQRVGNLGHRQPEITDALDMLFQGF